VEVLQVASVLVLIVGEALFDLGDRLFLVRFTPQGVGIFMHQSRFCVAPPPQV